MFGDEKLNKALVYAIEAHDGQYREGPGNVPYIVHPIRVARLVEDAGLSTDAIAAALLHDVVEDTDKKNDDIAREFGGVVAMLVAGLTNPPEYEDVKRPPRDERKREQLLRVVNAGPIVASIKMADMYTNMMARIKQERFDLVRDKLAPEALAMIGANPEANRAIAGMLRDLAIGAIL